MTKLYFVTDTEIFEDGERESHAYLSDTKPDDYKRKNYEVSSIEATYEAVTLDMMISAVEGDLENANHHGMIFLPSWLSTIMHKSLTPEQVKQVFWNLIQDKGTLWDG